MSDGGTGSSQQPVSACRTTAQSSGRTLYAEIPAEHWSYPSWIDPADAEAARCTSQLSPATICTLGCRNVSQGCGCCLASITGNGHKIQQHLKGLLITTTASACPWELQGCSFRHFPTCRHTG